MPGDAVAVAVAVAIGLNAKPPPPSRLHFANFAINCNERRSAFSVLIPLPLRHVCFFGCSGLHEGAGAYFAYFVRPRWSS